MKKEVLKYKNGKIERIYDEVVEEKYLKVFVNNREIRRVEILPEKIEYFVYGFFYTNGFIKEISEIKSFEIYEDSCFVEIENKKSYGFKNYGFGYKNNFILLKEKVESEIKISAERILYLIQKFNETSEIFKRTGGVHSCGLSDGNEIIIFADDISRHNAFDKVIGEGLFKNFNFKDKIILTTGRITSDVVIKGIQMKIPILISISAPTSYAIEIGEFHNITIIGFARGKRFNIYTNNWRIK